MTTTDHPETAGTGDADAFAERVFGLVLGAQQVQAIELGDRLGWYRALAEAGPLTSTELAARTASAERYAREWLEHQAVCGIVTVDDVAAAPAERRFALPAAHAAVLADPDSLTYLTPLARFVGASGLAIDKLAEAYRTGGGVSWAELGDDAREAQAAANRPMFLHRLGQQLLPAAPELHERLLRATRVADVGCGYGWSTIGLARAYPGTTVVGYDIDEPSILAARRNAAAAGLAGRVRFHLADAADLAEQADHEGDGGYDAVFAFECLHDVPDPVSVLAAMRAMAAEDGMVVVMDERTQDTFTAPGDEVEQLLYGYSLMCCLADGLAHQPSVGTGTVMRAETLAGYARDAGFAAADVLPIEDDFFRFYRLR
ncbi:MAG TPA: class I SAM-dependent methyltransferase [Acidimicrobiales bacterium]|nr:class I SAM-dependent methyltransferase [Acidimicrobiales bacterium]